MAVPDRTRPVSAIFRSRDGTGAKRSVRPFGLSALLGLATIAFSGSGYAAAAPFAAGGETTPALAIEPLTVVGSGGSGYLADPQPVHLAPSAANRVLVLSGTTDAIIRGTYPITPGGFSWTPVTVNAGSLRGPIAASGDTITNFQNLDLFQADDGQWHAAVTIGVRSATHPRHWTVIAHAHPVGATGPGGVPLAWSADALLSGSFSEPVEGNYDGKYFAEGGRVYLLYVRNVAPGPRLRNVIVLQPMRSPTVPAASDPVTLLGVGDRFGALASEQYDGTEAKLVEAPYLVRIGNKYALIYSTGAYLTPGYKAGVAWSDTLLPPPGGRYRKVLQADPLGLWGRPGSPAVRYLLQSERPRWPNSTVGAVIGPGVASVVRGADGGWWLLFNGFAPGDRPTGASGAVEGGHRRPFAVRLRVAVPADRTVTGVSDAALAGWMLPAAR